MDDQSSGRDTDNYRRAQRQFVSLVEHAKRQLHQRRTDQKHTAAVDRSINSTKWATWVIAIVGAIGLGLGILQYLVLKGQLNEMQSGSEQTERTIAALERQANTLNFQIDEMRVEQRPWLSIDVAPTRLTIERGKIPDVALLTTVTNVGKSPARDVSYLPILHIPIGSEGGFSDLARENCPRITMTGFAPILVPGDKYPQNLGILFSQQQISDAWAPVGRSDRKAFEAEVIICTAYRLPTGNDVHLLAVVAEIERLRDDAPTEFNILGKYGD